MAAHEETAATATAATTKCQGAQLISKCTVICIHCSDYLSFHHFQVQCMTMGARPELRHLLPLRLLLLAHSLWLYYKVDKRRLRSETTEVGELQEPLELEHQCLVQDLKLP
jgi:hypothetical protein